MMNEQERKAVEGLYTIEDAWKLAKENGYEGTAQEFDALCKKLARETDTGSMSLESLDAVAGGSFKSAMEAVGDWCADNKEILIGTLTGLTSIAVGYGVYRYKVHNHQKQLAEIDAKLDNASVGSFTLT